MKKPRRREAHGWGAVRLLALSAALLVQPAAHALAPGTLGGSAGQVGQSESPDQAELVENSREAGLLTNWHLVGRYGHRSRTEFARRFAPERWAAKEAAKEAGKPASSDATLQPTQGQGVQRYELLFPEGTFVLPPAMAGRKGVYYATSCTYLRGSGEWNVYLESGAEAVVFVDGRAVLTREANATGVQRETIHAESGYHKVMVKFVAQAAPFRVAILPPNSGSRRKNSTPYLQHSPGSDDLMAAVRMGGTPRTGRVLSLLEMGVGGDAASLGVFGELFAETAEGGKDLSGVADVVGSILPDGFKALRILAGEQRQPASNRGDAHIATA
jgi:hypothetical protein